MWFRPDYEKRLWDAIVKTENTANELLAEMKNDLATMTPEQRAAVTIGIRRAVALGYIAADDRGAAAALERTNYKRETGLSKTIQTIREYRINNPGASQRAVAMATGITRSTVQRYWAATAD